MPAGTYVTQIGDRSSLLMISAVTTQHQGLYTCSAQNRAGLVTHSAPLIVNGTFDIFSHIT